MKFKNFKNFNELAEFVKETSPLPPLKKKVELTKEEQEELYRDWEYWHGGIADMYEDKN